MIEMDFILELAQYSVVPRIEGDGVRRRLILGGRRCVEGCPIADVPMRHEHIEINVACETEYGGEHGIEGLDDTGSLGSVWSFVELNAEEDAVIQLRADLVLRPALFEEVVRITKAREYGKFAVLLTLDIDDKSNEGANWFIDRVPNPVDAGFNSAPMDIDDLLLRPWRTDVKLFAAEAPEVTRELDGVVNG